MTKDKLRLIVYPALFFVTAVLIISLSVWAAGGNTLLSAVNYIDGEVELADVRDEYLVGEEIGVDGITLKAGGKTFSSEEIEISVDNTSAGDKMVEVFHRDGSDYYRGYFPATYFLIRHLDMRQTPTGIATDDSGNVVGVEGMVLWAELSGKPKSFPQPNEEGLDTVIILGEDYYDLELEQPDENGGYTAKIVCGSVTASIYFVEADGNFVILDSPNRVMTFANESGTNASLTLYITSRGGNEAGKYNISEGLFVYRSENGVQTYQFDYYLEDGTWASVFHSEDMPAAIYRRDPDGEDALVVELDSVTFSGSSADWRRAILDN